MVRPPSARREVGKVKRNLRRIETIPFRPAPVARAEVADEQRRRTEVPVQLGELPRPGVSPARGVCFVPCADAARRSRVHPDRIGRSSWASYGETGPLRPVS
jgi:hypothetical protein